MNEMTDEELYRYDEKQQNDIRIAKPWDRDPKYFTNVKISLHALLKMLRHARKGGQLEIMGMLLGKLDISTMIVMDAFALPVEGTETRVNAHAQAYEYMTAYVDAAKETDRPEPVIGWYHSHPGYGCWLSGIDVGTQMLNQQFQDPFVAIVVDPIRTVSTGKVDIGAFRCYPKNFKPADELQPEFQIIPMDKIEDFGVHCKKYYSLEISYFKSDLDDYLLECLGNKYWYNTLGTTSLTTNSDYTTKQLTDLTGRLEQAESRIAKGGLTCKLTAPREQPGSSSSASISVVANSLQQHSHQHHQQQQQQQDFLAKVTGDCAKAAVDPITGLMGQIIKDSLFNLNKDNQKATASLK